MVQGQLGKTNSFHFQILSKIALTQQSCREDQVDCSVWQTSIVKRFTWIAHMVKCADAQPCRIITNIIEL
jgi:hypothetical protein